MFKIGEFSRIGSVTIETLRHYDTLGLLKPAHVDPHTGYRYYETKQLVTLNRIIVLKDVGFSLEEIARLLRDELSDGELRGMLKAQLAIAESEIEAVQLRHARIRTRLAQLEQVDSQPRIDVTLKPVDALTIASLRETIPTSADVGQQWGQMLTTIGAWIHAHRVVSGPALVLYHNEGFCDADIDTECAFVVRASATNPWPPPPAPIRIRQLEAVATMASVVVADYRAAGLQPAYAALGEWIGEHGYQIVGAPRELYHGSPAANDFTAEIQFPVAKA